MKQVNQNALISFLSNLNVQSIIALATVVTLLLGTWIVARLAPVVQDLALLNAQVTALEHTVQNRSNSIDQIPVILEWQKNQDEQLDRIENKLDRLTEK